MKTPVAQSVGLALALTVAWPFASQADDLEPRKLWTSVGSTATLSRPDLDKVVFSGPSISFATGVAGQIVARYNVVATDGLLSEPNSRPGIGLTVLYGDQGAGSSFTATLIRTSIINEGASATVVSFNSDNFPQRTGIQLNHVGACRHRFNFDDNAYHIEVVMTRAVGAPTPLLKALQLTAIPCID